MGLPGPPGMASCGGIESRLEPIDARWFPGVHQHHIEAARRRPAQAHQVVAGGQHDAPLLDLADAGGGAAMQAGAAQPHLDEDQGAVGPAHHQVDLAAATPRGPIIALQQTQSGGLQMRQGLLLGRIADGARAATGGCRRSGWLL